MPRALTDERAVKIGGEQLPEEASVTLEESSYPNGIGPNPDFELTRR